MPVNLQRSILILLLFVLPWKNPFAQEGDLGWQILNKLNQYRSHLLTKKPVERMYLGAFIQKIRASAIHEEVISQIPATLSYIQRQCSVDSTSWPHTNSILDSLFSTMSDAELQILINNSDIYDLISLGVLDLDYPHKLQISRDLYEELLFFELNNGSHIADIGAGTGEFGFILSAIYDSLHLTMNDIKPAFISYMSLKKDGVSDYFTDDSIRILEGEITSTGLSPNSQDILLLRNSFHHFDHDREMLKSIHASLKKGGRLYVHEKTKDLSDTPCLFALRSRQIKRRIAREGFELVREHYLSESILLHFAKMP